MDKFHLKLLEIFNDKVPWVYVQYEGIYDLYMEIQRADDMYADVLTRPKVKEYMRKWFMKNAPDWRECHMRYGNAMRVRFRTEPFSCPINGYGHKDFEMVNPDNQTYPALVLYRVAGVDPNLIAKY